MIADRTLTPNRTASVGPVVVQTSRVVSKAAVQPGRMTLLGLKLDELVLVKTMTLDVYPALNSLQSPVPAELIQVMLPGLTNFDVAIKELVDPGLFTFDAWAEEPFFRDRQLKFYIDESGEMFLGASDIVTATGAILSTLTNALGNILLAQAFAAPRYVSLHTSDPGVLGNPGSEVAGGSYSRQPTTWSTPSNKTTANKLKVIFVNMPPVTVTHIGVWAGLVGGDMYCWVKLAVPVAVASGQEFHIPVNDLIVTL